MWWFFMTSDPSHNENLVYFHANKCLGEEF